MPSLTDLRRAAVAAVIMLAATSGAASADLNDQQSQGSQAPEVPVAAAYPVIGALSYLAFRLFHRAKPGPDE